MAGKTSIEWTDDSWNPIVGCSIVSPGCKNCFAMRQAARIERMQEGSHYAGTTVTSKAGAVWSGKVAMAPDRILTAPLRWQKPRRIFVNSMGDLFHEDVPEDWIDRVFAVMALAPRHTFQVLTKRADRMRKYLNHVTTAGRIWFWIGRFAHLAGLNMAETKAAMNRLTAPLPNVWLGVSAEDQRRADERIPHLLATPAAVRFVSAEPLLGPIRMPGRYAVGEDGMIDTPSLDWIIVGGESGPGARVWPGLADAARSIRDQCQAAGVAFFMKQMAGERKAAMPPIPADLLIREMPR